MKKPVSIEEAREWLEGLADSLDRVPHASSRFAFASHSIRDFLNGKQPSLDHAFGLVRSRGAKKRVGKHLALALKASKMWLNGVPWKKICDDLSYEDERELRRICANYHEHVIEEWSKEILKEILAELHKELSSN